MDYMHDLRIMNILQGLSMRVAGFNTTMDTLRDDFMKKRRASMQIKKDADRCIKETKRTVDRFLAIASDNNIGKDWFVYRKFMERRRMFNELSVFFL